MNNLTMEQINKRVINLKDYINSPSNEKINHLEFIAEYANCKKIKKAV